MKRKLTALCSLFLVLALLAGCSGTPAATGTATAGTSATSGTTNQTTAATAATAAPTDSDVNANLNEIGTLPIVKEKITLTAMQYIRDTDAITLSDTFWYVQKCEEDTNIHIDYTQVNGSDWDTQINLMFASGDYPDIISTAGNKLDAEVYGVDQEILVPIDDLIEQYMPVYKSLLEQDEMPWQSLVRTDGKMYGVGRIADYGSNCGGEFFINQTWLDNLGLATPTNTEELYQALTAFVNNDPNGNGKKDEVGYEGIFDELTTYFFFLWGIPETSKHFFINDDAQVIFAPEAPGYREAIEYMAKLYAEGLMDPATITQDSNSKISMYNQNNVGLTTMHRLKSMGWDILEQDMVHLMPPAAEGYSVKFASDFSVASEAVFFTCTNEHLAESALWVDYQMNPQQMFETFYGPEGTLWDWNADGKCELGPAGDQGVMEYSLGVNGFYYMPSWHYNAIFQQPDYRQERIGYSNMYKDAGYILKYPDEYVLKLAKISADDQTQINQIFANIETLYDQAVSEMIMHGVDDAKWDTFMSNLKASGSEQYIAYYQTALDAYLAQ